MADSNPRDAAAGPTDLAPRRREHRRATSSILIDHPPGHTPTCPVCAETPQPVPPAGVAWLIRADRDPDALAAEWAAYPASAQRLDPGKTFSVVDAPSSLGLAALAKTRQYALGFTFGPIAVEGDRLLFLVDTLSIDTAAGLLPARDDAGTDLRVRLRGTGSTMMAGPPAPQQSEQELDCWWLLAPAADPPGLPAAAQVVRTLVATANAALRGREQ